MDIDQVIRLRLLQKLTGGLTLASLRASGLELDVPPEQGPYHYTNPDLADQVVKKVDDADEEVVVGFTGEEAIAVYRLLAEAPAFFQRLQHAEREADAFVTPVLEATQLFFARGGKTDERMRAVGRHFGWVRTGGKHGHRKRDYEALAREFEGLLADLGRERAITEIEARYSIAWDSLQRAWRRHGIKVQTTDK